MKECNHKNKVFLLHGAFIVQYKNAKDARKKLSKARRTIECRDCKILLREESLSKSEKENIIFRARENHKMHARTNKILSCIYNIDKQEWTKKGRDAIYAMEKMEKKYPDFVESAGVDDFYFCGARIFFVQARTDFSYFCATAIYIPQCTGENPIMFHMYPSHAHSMNKALAKVLSDMNDYGGAL